MSESVAIDISELLKRIGQDPELLNDTLDMFLDSPDRVPAMRESLRNGDIGTLTRLSHTIKGLAMTISAPRLAKAAATLESEVRAGRLTQAQALIDCVETEFRLLKKAVAEYRHLPVDSATDNT